VRYWNPVVKPKDLYSPGYQTQACASTSVENTLFIPPPIILERGMRLPKYISLGGLGLFRRTVCGWYETTHIYLLAGYETTPGGLVGWFEALMPSEWVFERWHVEKTL
jgi:hypothetical protein